MSMDYSTTKRVFIFADESGNVGDPEKHTSASPTFTINIAVATDDGVQNMGYLISGFKFFNDHKKELKKLKGEHLKSFASKIPFLDNVKFYEMIIDKRKYSGPHLRGRAYRESLLWFRNFILKETLEYMAKSEKLFSFRKPIELVIDRYAENKEHADNLRDYLIEKCSLLQIQATHIVQVDSRYCPQIQMLDIIQKAKSVYTESNLCIQVPVSHLQMRQPPMSGSLRQIEKRPGCPNGPGASFPNTFT